MVSISSYFPFAAANAPGATERVDDTWDGAPLFPNGKVVGGWDFVGPRYNPPHICTAADEAAGECTSTPDPDPLDGGSHGTHVAGIVAGEAIPGVADGVAPGARIVALKLYGSGGADEAADVRRQLITARLPRAASSKAARYCRQRSRCSSYSSAVPKPIPL